MAVSDLSRSSWVSAPVRPFKFLNFMNNIFPQKFFLYARKFTDVEDKQVLSIEAQLTELREYAKREAIEISAEVVEK